MNQTFSHRAFSDFVLSALLVVTASIWPIGAAFARNRPEDFKYLIPIAIFVLIWFAVFTLIQSLRGKPTTKLHFLFSLWLAPLTFVVFLDPIRDVIDSPPFTAPQIRERPLPKLRDMSPPPSPPSDDPARPRTPTSKPSSGLQAVRSASIDEVNNATLCYALWAAMEQIPNCKDCNREIHALPKEAIRKATVTGGSTASLSLSDLSQLSKNAALSYAFEMTSTREGTEKSDRFLLASALTELSVEAARGQLEQLIADGDATTLRTKMAICALGIAQYKQAD